MPAALTESTVVWIAEGGSTSVNDVGTPALVAPTAEASRSLDTWAAARGAKLAAPTAEPPPSKAIDWSAADDVERAIATAREALVAIDLDAAGKALEHAQSVLRDHPELPQSAWLLAEVERAWSARWLREAGTAATTAHTADASIERAKAAWQRAAGLDSGRAPGLGEKTWDAPPTVTATIRLEGEAAGILHVDGEPTGFGEVRRSEGDHAVVVQRADGSIASAAWLSWSAGAALAAIVPSAPACSRDDVARARLSGDRVVATGVRCERWVAAIDRGGGVVRIGTCELESCGALVEWRVSSSASWTYAPIAPIAPPETHPRWPAWATWTIAGVGVAGAALAVVVASGALKAAPTETQFVNGGLKVH